MTLNRRDVTLAEIKYFYGGRHKNFNEDRSMLSAVKCKPMILVPRNNKAYAVICGGSIEEGRQVQ